MDNINRLAKLFKERDNNEWMGIQIGTVVASHPLSIQIGDKVILTSRHLFLSYRLKEFTREFEIDGQLKTQSATDFVNYKSNGSLKLKESYLKAGDHVALIPTMDEQQFVVIDKVVRE